MVSDGAVATPAKVTPKKANLIDMHSIKHLIDDTISDVRRFTLNPGPSSLSPLLDRSSHLVPSDFASDTVVPWCVQVLKSKGYMEDTFGQLEVGDRGIRDRSGPTRAILPEEVPTKPGVPPWLHRIISFSSLGLLALFLLMDRR
ncbi:hypothetical protein C2845_PM15G09690 [Panicum miliaceum]|uniref:Uncharacterized protein n=1 Tax=Panicum miliaceum TaxID=4540 RepID=A0A3L6Q6Z7_PANMI|nr:hypothetical protein C2845_PM15G09690 [Panicum miliaceum]